jgi:hypothetical protein
MVANSCSTKSIQIMLKNTISIFHVKWVSCHHGTASAQGGNGAENLQIWLATTNILDKHPRTTGKGWSPQLWRNNLCWRTKFGVCRRHMEGKTHTHTHTHNKFSLSCFLHLETSPLQCDIWYTTRLMGTYRSNFFLYFATYPFLNKGVACQ